MREGKPGAQSATAYTIVVEETPRNFTAYAPDLPGCVATGSTRDDVVREMLSAIAMHIESLREHSELVPAPSDTAQAGRPTQPSG